MWTSSLETRFAGREAGGAGRAGLEGLLELVSGIGGSGCLSDAGTSVVALFVVLGATAASCVAVVGSLTTVSEYLDSISAMFALRRLVGMRLIRLSIRDRRSED